MSSQENSKTCSRIPKWLRVKLPSDPAFFATQGLIKRHGLNTVCQSAKCPNSFECFSKKVATFLIMGNTCTRNCAFCNIEGGHPAPLDADEPRRVAEAASELGLKHVVITSVTRDDLPDGGAGHFAEVIRQVRSALPRATIEVLIPDFQRVPGSLETVLQAGPEVLNHNLETAPRLYPHIRPKASYAQSLDLLVQAKKLGPAQVKSGIMAGLGETDDEVEQVIRDVAETGAHMMTIGQYMRPSVKHPKVERYVEPATFEKWSAYGRKMGIRQMFSAPLVRSSYNAGEFV